MDEDSTKEDGAVRLQSFSPLAYVKPCLLEPPAEPDIVHLDMLENVCRVALRVLVPSLLLACLLFTVFSRVSDIVT